MERSTGDLQGPTRRDLRAIEAEWPVIAAELAVVDAEVTAARTVRPSELDARRLRRARAVLLRELAVAARAELFDGQGGAA